MRNFINLIENVSLPTISLDRVWHVGSMDQKQKRKGGYEGSGLSISRHPNAWMEIGRGHVSGKIWELTRAGNRFLDYHALTSTQKNTLQAWGIKNGYLEPHTSFIVRYYDDEWEQERWMDFSSREKAEEEAESMGVDDIEEIFDAVRPTPKLNHRTLNAPGDLDALIPVYVEDMTDLDGVWWQDSYDPERLSAPRGVIVLPKLTLWTITEIEDVDDDEPDYDGGPETPNSAPT